MKMLIISISLMLFAALSFAQWTWQNPLPQGHTLRSVYFTDTKRAMRLAIMEPSLRRLTVVNTGVF